MKKNNYFGDGLKFYNAVAISGMKNEDLRKAMDISNGKFYLLYNKKAFSIEEKELTSSALGIPISKLYGEISKYNSLDNTKSTRESKNDNSIPKMDGGIKPVPVYDVDFSAGTAISLIEARGTYYPVAWLSTPEVAGCDLIVRARGDSMEDRINDKDWIGIKRIYNFKTDGFIPGLIYAIVTREQEIVKYVFKGKDDKHVLIKSHNTFYQDFEQKIDKIMELWQVRVVIPVSKIQTF